MANIVLRLVYLIFISFHTPLFDQRNLPIEVKSRTIWCTNLVDGYFTPKCIVHLKPIKNKFPKFMKIKFLMLYVRL